ncbi:MAG: adenosylcobinamide-GDP ribazoletransferase [Oscillospiraceae bacterium]|nr:adenosylcobinamide-GDP ribazoletransferase [Oscillospiraceae bacterium]
MLFKSFLTAFATYSAIPVPRFRWDERAADYALGFFPAVGAVCGCALGAWFLLCRRLGADWALFSAVAVCLPLFVTGGIHMDGYMDTADAVASHQSRERKLEIMKDSGCGAFAVIWCGIYLLLSFGLFHALYPERAIWAVCPGYVLSRALSALCALLLPKARRTGMLHTYTGQSRNPGLVSACAAEAILAAGVTVLLGGVPGLCAVLLAGVTVPLYRLFALRQFGGVTGDTAGAFLQVCELAVLAGLWIGERIA